MSDSAPAPEADAPETPDAPDTGTGAPDLQAELDKWKAQARKHEERAKANSSAVKELETLRKASMTDLEKAVDAARSEGRAEAIREVGTERAADAIRLAAAGRMADGQVMNLLGAVDLTKFLLEDGKVDAKSVAAFVDGIAPKVEDQLNPGFPDLGQGARGLNGTGDMNSLIRRQLGRT